MCISAILQNKNLIYKNYSKIQQYNGRKVLAKIKFPGKNIKETVKNLLGVSCSH